MSGPVRWSAVIGVMALLWWSSSRSPKASEPNLAWAFVHNAMHLIAFGTLALATWFACRSPASPGNARVAALAAVALAGCYGMVDEIHQSFVPGRTSSPSDVLTDLCGAAAAVWLVRLWFGESRPRVLVGLALTVASAGSVVLATIGPW